MVQGAPQVAGRFPEPLRQYKAPPPEICSEQFYETDAARGFARGFSIQTVGPLPIDWAEHVLADGHWGHALREYMRDYNHWTTLGLLCELLPQPENRVTLADETDEHGMPVARMDYTQCDNDRANIAYGKRVLERIWEAADAQDTLTIDRYAHLVGGCRMGTAPENSVIDADHRAWGVPNLVRLRRQRDAHAGLGEPRADDHGARLPARRAAVKLRADAYTIPTDAPESDGTFAWDSTTIVVVEVSDGGERGLGYSYGPAALVPLILRHAGRCARDGTGWSARSATWVRGGWRCTRSRRSTSRSGTSRRGGSACRWWSCSAAAATPSRSTARAASAHTTTRACPSSSAAGRRTASRG